ncbi:hypothetical protein [Dulcicalothrix desertica]|nr:hypothetical protein [Dulcicalothrix desertica]
MRIVGQQIAKYADGREDTVGVTEALFIECEGHLLRSRHVKINFHAYSV